MNKQNFDKEESLQIRFSISASENAYLNPPTGKPARKNNRAGPQSAASGTTNTHF